MCAAIVGSTMLGEKNIMLTDVPEICRACAVGSTKAKHNFDSKTCRYGRLQSLDSLATDEEKIEALRVEERLGLEVASMILSLSKERGKSIIEILREECIITS